VDAVRAIVAGGLSPDEVDEAAIAARLYTAGMPDPDLVIRTGGEQRLSNFLIWQSAYAEFWSCEVLWPDFDAPAYDGALAAFAQRSRRFGA
jgi:undecaprenyl diphosphate synthase